MRIGRQLTLAEKRYEDEWHTQRDRPIDRRADVLDRSGGNSRVFVGHAALVVFHQNEGRDLQTKLLLRLLEIAEPLAGLEFTAPQENLHSSKAESFGTSESLAVAADLDYDVDYAG